MEAVKTNILGSSNVIDAALDAGVERVLALSTDKAVSPVNLYGATKLAAEKLFVQSNYYSGDKATRLACTRYGNVVGSRGSVVPLFLKQRSNGGITITDERMTRFWISLEQGARFVIRCAEQMQGGEVFVPKIPSMAIMDLANAIAPGAKVNITGIRPGEKLHELLISEDEARNAVELEDMYVVMPAMSLSIKGKPLGRDWEALGQPLEDGFRYASNTNPQWLTVEQIRGMVSPIETAYNHGALE
jgi:UDP-N-acetylglucosamine 4,6-dehydratase